MDLHRQMDSDAWIFAIQLPDYVSWLKDFGSILNLEKVGLTCKMTWDSSKFIFLQNPQSDICPHLSVTKSHSLKVIVLSLKVTSVTTHFSPLTSHFFHPVPSTEDLSHP